MMRVYVTGAVEGIVDEAIFARLVRVAKAEAGPVHRTDGKSRLLARLKGFDRAARREPWLVLVDLNGDANCAPEFCRKCLKSPSELMAFRVAVRAVEAWVLADRVRVASWLSVPQRLVPGDPDTESDPKRTVVGLAARSASKAIREEMVPRPGSGRKVGQLYSSRLIAFIGDQQRGWRPSAAAKVSDSLRRCLKDLRRVTELAGSKRERSS